MHTHDQMVTDVAATETEIIEDRVSPMARLGQLMVLVPGVALVVSGTVTLAKTGIHKDLATPIVSVWGHTHTPWLGIVELAVGLVLVGFGASWVARQGALVVGVLLAVAGVLVLADPNYAPNALAVQSGYGWIPLAAGVVVSVGALLPGGVTRVRRRSVERP